MWNRFNRSDQIIFAVAFVGLLAFSYLTANESIFFTGKEKIDAPVFGKLVKTANDVRHKKTKQFQWKDAKSASQIHIGDSLFTGPDSKAQVEIPGGTRLDVGANSMVFFDKNADKLTLNLEFGKIDGTLSGAGGMRLKIGADLVDLSSATGGEISLSKNSGIDGFEVESLSGEFNVKTNHNESQIGSGKKLSVSKTGEQQIEVAKKEAAIAEILRKKKEKEEAELKAQEAKLAELRSRSEFVWIKPASDTNFEIKLDENKKPIESPKVFLEWRASPVPEQTVVQLSKDPSFANPLSTTLPGNSWETAPLEEGQYFARLRPTTAEDNWSKPVSFTVTKGRPPQLAAPVLINPEISYRWPSPDPANVQWKKLAKAGAYKLDVATDISFSNIVYSESKIAGQEQPLPNLGGGRYFFRVAGITSAGTLGAASRTGTLDVVTDRPAMLAVESKDILGKGPKDPPPPLDFALQWKSLGEGTLYEVQVARKDDFSDAKSLKTKSASSSVKLREPGQYHTRVRAVAADGKALSEFSDPRSFDYKYRIPLTSPQPLEPAKDYTLFFQRPEDVFFWMTWKPIRDNELYEVEIARDNGFSQILVAQKTSEARLMIKSTPLEGDLFWRVRSTSTKQISQWSEPRALKIVTAKSRLPAKAPSATPAAPASAPKGDAPVVAPPATATPQAAALQPSAPQPTAPVTAPKPAATPVVKPTVPAVTPPTTTAPPTTVPAATPTPVVNPQTPATPTATPPTPTPTPSAPKAPASMEPKAPASMEPKAPASMEPKAPASVEPKAPASVAPTAPAIPVPPRRLVPDDE